MSAFGTPVRVVTSFMRLVPVIVALLFNPALGFASDLSDRAIKLFMENKPREAAAALEMAVNEAGADEKLALYLGIAYQQLGRWDDAIAAFRKGLVSSMQYRHMYLFNIANSFYAQDRISFALEYYDQVLVARSDYAPGYLNRANAKMRLNDHSGASIDYSRYLVLDPGSTQAGEIRKLLDLLGTKAAQADQFKAAEEARRIAEEQARQAMLDAVTRSLMEAAESTTNLSAGSGDAQGYDADLSLDE
jgi:tetratricopeptide (TPR) repeat protein